MPHLIDNQQIRAALRRAGLSYVEDLNPDLALQLSTWLNMMLAAPRNLTAIQEPEAAIAKHVIEPLAGRHRLISADLPLPDGPLIDIGSGNGAPGLPLALCEPGREATLLDARSGTVSFLAQVISEIGAAQVTAVQERAEVAAHSDRRERFAFAVSRAAAAPSVSMELMIPFLQIGGIAAAWTGILTPQAAADVAQAVEVLGSELTPIDPPNDILVATKLRPTERRYPRPWNQIRRRPLGSSRP
jgi:16S rRNA (guanine527-N7)-methyltransferase